MIVILHLSMVDYIYGRAIVKTEWQEHLRPKTFQPYLHTVHMQFTFQIQWSLTIITSSVVIEIPYMLMCLNFGY